jgi:hypothetical protein
LIQEITLSKKIIKEVRGKYTKELDSLCEALAKISSGEKEDQIVSFSDLDARFGKTS